MRISLSDTSSIESFLKEHSSFDKESIFLLLDIYAENSYYSSCIFMVHNEDCIINPIFESDSFYNLQNILHSDSFQTQFEIREHITNDNFFKLDTDTPFYRNLEFNKKNRKKW